MKSHYTTRPKLNRNCRMAFVPLAMCAALAPSISFGQQGPISDAALSTEIRGRGIAPSNFVQDHHYGDIVERYLHEYRDSRTDPERQHQEPILRIYCNGSVCIDPRNLCPNATDDDCYIRSLPEDEVDAESMQSSAQEVSSNDGHDAESNVEYESVGLDILRNHLTDSTNGGDAEAQRRLAEMYHNGLGGPRRIDDAMRYYRLAASQGDVQATLALVDLLIEVQRENSDPTEIRSLLQNAARGGTPLAQVKLGAWL